MDDDELLGQALLVARQGLDAGELPIGAVLIAGRTVIAEAYTEEMEQGRRLVHAELLAMIEAERQWGWGTRPGPLTLASTLEPCLMCMGAAMSLGVSRVVFGLYSPGDGAAAIGRDWPPHPSAPFFRAPTVAGGIRSADVRALFVEYAATRPDSGLREWAASLAAG